MIGSDSEALFQRTVNEERDVSAARVIHVRVLGVFAWFVFQTLGALSITVDDSPDSRAIAPILGIYLLLAIVQLVVVRSRPSLRRLTWYSVPLLDLPMFFMVNYRVIQTTDYPQFNMGASMSSWLVLLTVAQFSLRRGVILAMAFLSMVFQIAIYVRGGMPYMWPMAVIVVGTAAAIALQLTTRNLALLRRITDDGVQRLEEMRALTEELRHQVADRSRELASALAQLQTLPPAGTPSSGEVIDGRYRITSLLGKGAMGAVYEARRISDDRVFAIKLMRGATTPQALARFAREAEFAAQLRHANLVEVWDVGIESSGRFFLVMELVEGQALEASRSRFGDVSWALPILRQIAAGLVAIHEMGIVHRDLKPANVLLSANGCAKITDFGVAGLTPQSAPLDTLTDDGQALTRTGALLGTPRYMAPELGSGARDAESSADVFSFGVLAYEMLSARPAFTTPPVRERLAGGVPSPAAPLPASGVDARVASCIDRCLELDPGRRPSAAEIVEALAP